MPAEAKGQPPRNPPDPDSEKIEAANRAMLERGKLKKGNKDAPPTTTRGRK